MLFTNHSNSVEIKSVERRNSHRKYGNINSGGLFRGNNRWILQFKVGCLTNRHTDQSQERDITHADITSPSCEDTDVFSGLERFFFIQLNQPSTTTRPPPPPPTTPPQLLHTKQILTSYRDKEHLCRFSPCRRRKWSSRRPSRRCKWTSLNANSTFNDIDTL